MWITKLKLNYLPRIAEKFDYLKGLPVAALRVAQSALINNPIYRLIIGKQKKTYDKMPATHSYGKKYASAYA